MGTSHIRHAETEADRQAVFRLRYELYVEQQGLFGDTADHDNRWLSDSRDASATLLMAEVEGRLVGTTRIVWGSAGLDAQLRETFEIDRFTDLVSEDEIAVGSRFLVLPEFRQSKVVFELNVAMVEALIERDAEIMLGECEPHLVNTWTRMGTRAFGIIEHPTNGMLIRIAFLPGDLERARSLGSPLAPVMAKRTKQSFAPRRLAARLSSIQRVVGEAKDGDQFWAQVEQTVAIDRLAQILGGLEPAEFEALLSNSVALDCDPGSWLIREGHVSRTLYILLSGSLEVWDGERKVVEVTQPGEIIGEVAFFSRAKRMSDVKIGAEGAQVLALSDRSLAQLIATQGSGAAKFMVAITRGLCHKLHQRAG